MDTGGPHERLRAVWPLAGLVVRTPRLELRYPDDADLVTLAELSDHIHDEGTMPFTTPWSTRPAAERHPDLLRFHWGQRAAVQPERWSLGLATVVDGSVVGTQEVSAEGFAVRRTVSTGSWLARSAQGRGLGTEMRAAVLHLAFAGLGALRAETSAYADNVASQRVSERLGYLPDGEEVDALGDERRTARRYALTRERWEERRRRDIEVQGLDPCRPLLGA